MHKLKIMAAAIGAFVSINSFCYAENSKLAVLENVDTENGYYAELWGNKLKNGYADNLLLLIKNTDGTVAGAYNPTVAGGYNCVMESVQLKDDKKQILLSAAQGDWSTDTEFRIIDISNLEEIKELFTAADNYGVIKDASIEDNKLHVVLTDDNKSSMQIDSKLLESIPADRLQADYGRMYSVSCRDIDEDGIDEVFTVQKISADKKVLADVGAVWRFDKEQKWQKGNFTILVAGFTDKKNTINNGADTKRYTVLPRKIVLPDGEGTYPIVICRDDLQLQEKINTVLQQETKKYLDNFFAGQADLAFNVLRADDKLLTIQLISGKNKFIHHHINIDPVSGESISIYDILNAGDKDLLPLLDLLNTNENIEFTEGLPEEWYLIDGKLYLIVNVCGEEQAAGYAIGNLHKYIKDKKWLNN